MGKKLYYVRHGESVLNVDSLVCGRTDAPLSPRGVEQARTLANRVKEQGLRADMVITSPLERARVTGGYIAEALGLPITVDARLIENDYGEFENKSKFAPEFIKSKGDFADAHGGTESQLRVGQRVFNLLDELAKDDRVYILAAHNGIARMVNAYFNNLSNEEFSSYTIDNCTLVEFEYK